MDSHLNVFLLKSLLSHFIQKFMFASAIKWGDYNTG